jgi:hypothetical protein
MSRDKAVYDLGEVFLDAPPTARGERAAQTLRRATPTVQAPAAHVSTGAAVAASVSLFFPGGGQLLAGEVASGLFFLTGFAFCGALAWAILSTIDRIVPTLQLFGIDATVLLAATIFLLFCAAILHVAGVLHADGLDPLPRRTPHPVGAAIASMIVPGWGQLRSGHRRRAALFLGGVWTSLALWALVSPAASPFLATLGVSVPVWLRDGAGPIVLVTLPVVIWIVAVYDAVAGAMAERRRS